ncbi:MAG TPA: hypothetical protein VF316_16775 [Polyangiaceae bacterium]
MLSSKYVVALVSLAAAACGGQTIGDLDAGGDAAADAGGDAAADAGTGDGGHCTTDAECGPGSACGFAESQGCAALGQCFPAGPTCKAYSPGCACSGQTINVVCNGLPSGYVPAPLAHLGVCVGPGDAGAAFPCGNAVCVAGQQVCYIPAHVGPDAGACVPSNGCADCACAQATFQCISTCKQSGLAIYVQCQ